MSDFWRFTVLQRSATTLIQHLSQLTEVFRIDRNQLCRTVTLQDQSLPSVEASALKEHYTLKKIGYIFLSIFDKLDSSVVTSSTKTYRKMKSCDFLGRYG